MFRNKILVSSSQRYRFINEKAFESMPEDADELAKILFSILKKTRI